MPRVYIGKLSYHVREKDIQRFFSGYGKLLEIDLKNGYGFVEFEDMRDADDAVYELNGKELCGERVVIEHARGPRRDGYGYGGQFGRFPVCGGYSSWNRNSRDKYGPPVRTEHRLIVENLSSRCSWQDLKDFMRQAGEVTYADAHKGRANEGVIEFRSRSDMKRALEKLDGTDINGRKIRLVEDKSRRKRSKSRSKSAEKSRSHTRKSRSPSKNKKSRSRSDTRKSRSKSSSKVKAALKSRSPSQEKSSSKKSRSRSRSLSESRGEKCASKSPPSKGASKSPAKRSASRSRSPSRSRSASQD
uniref:Serine and arginine rich splicing factor 6 n=1 Tax=Amphilophus citrinellus TaxID=61819 RepID=A0A3Q0STK6_AMPCI